MPEIGWPVLEPDVSSILQAEPEPIKRLAHGDAAAVVVRRAFPAAECRGLVRLLIEEGLMYEMGDPRIAERSLKNDVIGRYLGRSVNPDDSPRRRIDIGASLGNYGDDKDEFFPRSDEANRLFDRLFSDRPNPISAVYDSLGRLVPGKRVVTAYEPDGRCYGPAIFRIHYGGFTYGPHFDSVRHREKRTDYAVYRFEQQLAGVLCIQNSTLNGVSAQGIMHRQFWNEEIDPLLRAGAFHEFAAERCIPNVRVELEPGDLYFFNTGMIHEVPGVPAEQPRVVLATFIGYSDDDGEVMVWS